MGGEALKRIKCILCGINTSKRVARTWRVLKEVAVQVITEPVTMLKMRGGGGRYLEHSDRHLKQLNVDKEIVKHI
jgi:hypothetical protein